MADELTFCLFAGRHELPENRGPIFESFDFETFKGVRTPKYAEVISELREGKTVNLLVTGLTPALTELLSEVTKLKGKLVLLHFNRERGSYQKQTFKETTKKKCFIYSDDGYSSEWVNSKEEAEKKIHWLYENTDLMDYDYIEVD